MNFKLIIIGDEILSGKRKDCHLGNLISLLSSRGLALNQCTIIGDEPALIISTLQEQANGNSVIFCCGGIGATPDDYTRQCAADAFNVALERHPMAKKLIEEQFSNDAYPKRILMADLPQGASIIPNPINQVPGFSVGDNYFVPGFPQMAQPMMEWVLDEYYAAICPAECDREIERSVWIYHKPESELIDLMNAILDKFPNIKIASLPSAKERHSKIDFSIKGKKQEVDVAFNFLLSQLDVAAINYQQMIKT